MGNRPMSRFLHPVVELNRRQRIRRNENDVFRRNIFGSCKIGVKIAKRDTKFKSDALI